MVPANMIYLHQRCAIFIVALLCAIAIVSFPSSSKSQDKAEIQSILDAELPASRDVLLGKIAEIAFPGPDNITPILEDMGFKPEATLQLWSEFPVINKLENAYRGAEAAKQGGGALFLSDAIRRLSDRYDFIRNDAQLAAYAKNHPLTGNKLEFATQAVSSRLVMDPASRDIIAHLADQMERGILGSGERVLSVYFGLAEVKAYEILSKSKTYKEAITRAYGELDKSQGDAKLIIIMDEIKKRQPQLKILEGVKQALAIVLLSAMVKIESICPAHTDPCGCSDGRDLGCVPEGTCVGAC